MFKNKIKHRTNFLFCCFWVFFANVVLLKSMNTLQKGKFNGELSSEDECTGLLLFFLTK